MSRRGGQSGTVVKKGNWWHGRYYIDLAGSTKRARKSVAIGHCDEMTKPEARRKLAVMLHELGVNSNSYLEKALTPVKLFSEHAEWWEANVLPMHKPSSQELEPLHPEEAPDSVLRTNADGCNIRGHCPRMDFRTEASG